MKKRFLLTALFVVMLVCVLAFSISASDFKSSYTENVTKFYDTDGTTELMPEWVDLDDKNATAVLKLASGEIVRIPLYYIYQEKGTELSHEIRTSDSNSGFRYEWVSTQLANAGKLQADEAISHANLVALEIPEGTKTTSGLSSYTALEEVVFPLTATGIPKSENNATVKRVFVRQELASDGTVKGITKIADYAFKNAKKLEYFKLELDYATYVGNNAFLNCLIKEFTVQGPITGMGSAAFSGCTQLKTVYINNTSDTVVSIGSQAFKGSTGLTSVTLNGFSIPSYTFENVNGLTGGLTVKLTNVTTFGEMPFKNALNLEHIEITGPITNFGSSTFLGCHNLSTVKVVNTLDTPAACGNNTFDGLKGLTSVEMHGVSISGYAFRSVNGPSTMKVTLTNVGSVGYQAFYKAQNISELYISGPLTAIDSGSYRECPSLKKLTVINTGDTLVTAGNGESNPLLEEIHLEGKFTITGSPVFQNNPSLKHVYLGHGVEVVGERAFYQCYALETMYLADTITTIGDRAIDMEASGRQTSASFMFVDENGNMDNTLPASLEAINGHFLKHITIANTQLIFPQTFTNHNSTQAYDFEGTIYPQGFSLVYLGKMTAINLKQFYKHNGSKDVAIYLANNTASDIKNYRVTANVLASGDIAHGTYAGVNESGTLEIMIDSGLQNNINATGYAKFIFCGSDEICFVTRVNIVWGDSTSSGWGDFVSTPVTYAQLEAAYAVYNEANPDNQKTPPAKHPAVGETQKIDPTCTQDGGIVSYCLYCNGVVTFEKTENALGHSYDILNAISITYVDFTKDGTFVTECEACHEEITEVAKDSHLVALTGIATKQESEGVCVGYFFNVELIAAYTGLGNTFDYGVVAYIPDEAETNIEPMANDLTCGEYTISAPLSSASCSNVEFVIRGVTSEYSELPIVMCAYVYDGNEVDYVNAAIGESSVVVTQDDYASTITLKQITDFKKK